MNIKIIVLFGLIFTIMCAVTIPAAAIEILSLDGALQLARSNNPSMIEARKAVEAAKGEAITAGTISNPEIEMEVGGFKKKDGSRGNLNLDTIGVKQQFGPPGVLGLKGGIANNTVMVREESLKSIWSEIYRSVREAYTKIILDKKQLELAMDNLNVLRQFYSQVQLRFQSGKASKNDLQRAKIELIKTENNYLFSEKELKTDKAKFNLLLGRTIDPEIDIEGELKEEELQLDLKDLTDIAYSKRPDLKTERLNLDSKAKSLLIEQLSRLPAFSLGIKANNEDYNDDAYTAVAGLDFPLWNLNRGEIKKAEAEKEAQATKLETAKKEAALDVYGAYLSADLAHKQLDLLRKSLEEANELLRLANLSYSEGEIDFLNFLDQTRVATETRIKYYQGLFILSGTLSELEKSVYSSIRKGEDYLK